MYTEPQAGSVLPRGRHGLTRKDVRESQRDRLLAAAITIVADEGYERATVAKLIAHARVSRTTFYEQFADRRDCFNAACEEISSRLVADLNRTATRYATWVDGLKAGTDAFLAWIAKHPEEARVAFIGIPEAGRGATDQLDTVLDRFDALYGAVARRARREHPDLPPLSPSATRLLGAGVFELVGREVRERRADRITALSDELFRLQLTVLMGDRDGGSLGR